MLENALIAALPSLITLVEHGIEAIEKSATLSDEEKQKHLDDLQARLDAQLARVAAVKFKTV